MKVELEKTFPMPAAPEVAWAFLQDIEGVAGCMPGAKITERIDATHFKGTVSIRVGPASMSFRGDIEVRELDANQRLLHLIGKGSDTTGSSGASMDLVARVEPNAADGLSQLVGRSEVTMSGKAAAFGGRMMGSVADQILKQFAGNFAAQVQARAAAATAVGATPTAAPASAETATITASVVPPARNEPSAVAASKAAPAPAPTSTTTAQPQRATVMQSASASAIQTATAPAGTDQRSIALESAVAPATGASSSAPLPLVTCAPSSAQPPAAAHASSVPTLQPPAPANELNLFALLWAIIRDWFRGLFRRRPA